MIEEERPEDVEMEAGVNFDRPNGAHAQPLSAHDDALSATEPTEDGASVPLAKLASTSASADLNKPAPSAVTCLVADASANLCNLSLDE